METVAFSRISNDTSPDLLDSGGPTEFQITSEVATAFWWVLKQYGVPLQLANFIFRIYTRQKPGSVYYWTDQTLAEDFGLSSRNYICSVRKNLKKWNNGNYRSGLKHFAFVSVTEHTYNPRTKTQKPTGYETSPEFQNLIYSIVAEARETLVYRDNWIAAIKEVCSRRRQELFEFGYWNERKQKRERSIHAVLGTMLLNWTGTMRRMMNVAETAGIPAEFVADKLKEIFPAALDAAVNETLVIGPAVVRGETLETSARVPIRATKADFKLLWSKVAEYVSEKTEVPETVIPRDFKEAGHNDTNSFRHERGEDVHARGTWDSRTEKPRQLSVLEHSAALQSGGALPPAGLSRPGDDRLDRERLRFMEKHSRNKQTERELAAVLE